MWSRGRDGEGGGAQAGPRPRCQPVAAYWSVPEVPGREVQRRHRCADEGPASQAPFGTQQGPNVGLELMGQEGGEPQEPSRKICTEEQDRGRGPSQRWREDVAMGCHPLPASHARQAPGTGLAAVSRAG